MAISRDRVYFAIDSERDFQDRKWGTVAAHPHEVGGWLTIMRKLLADADAAWAGRSDDRPSLEEIRKVIATGVACCEQHGVPSRMLGTGNPAGYAEDFLSARRAKTQPPAVSFTCCDTGMRSGGFQHDHDCQGPKLPSPRPPATEIRIAVLGSPAAFDKFFRGLITTTSRSSSGITYSFTSGGLNFVNIRSNNSLVGASFSGVLRLAEVPRYEPGTEPHPDYIVPVIDEAMLAAAVRPR